MAVHALPAGTIQSDAPDLGTTGTVRILKKFTYDGDSTEYAVTNLLSSGYISVSGGSSTRLPHVDGIYYTIKTQSGMYVQADEDGYSAYSYAGLTSDVDEATKFYLTASAFSVVINDAPVGLKMVAIETVDSTAINGFFDGASSKRGNGTSWSDLTTASTTGYTSGQSQLIYTVEPAITYTDSNGYTTVDGEANLVFGFTNNICTKTDFSITKVTNSTTITDLSGITFTVSGTSDNGEAVSLQVTTDSTGLAEFEDVPIGTYTVSEDLGSRANDFTGYNDLGIDGRKTWKIDLNDASDGSALAYEYWNYTEITQKASITLTKRIRVDEIDDSIWYEHGAPTFVLELTNTDDDITYRHSFEFTEDYVSTNKFEEGGVEYVEISYTWNDLDVAHYTATEVNTVRYTLEDIINISDNGTMITLTKTSDNVNTPYAVEFDTYADTEGYATFYNVKNTYKDLSDNCIIVNDII